VKTEKISVRITTDAKKKLHAVAKQNKREPSDYIRLLIEHAIKKKIKFK